MLREMKIEDIKLLKFDEAWKKVAYERYLEAQTGPAWIMEVEGKPVCAFGAAFLWTGVCEVWYHLIEKVATISQIRTIRRYLDEESKKQNVKRMHAMIRCDFEIGNKFVTALGFKCETPDGMENFNQDGSSAYMYSRLVKE